MMQAEKTNINQGEQNGMLIKTILNRVQKYSSFVYESVSMSEENQVIEVQIRPRANSWPICTGCQRPGPGYDTLPARWFEFIPLWGFQVFFVYAMRRVACSCCGIKVESVPWAKGKNHLSETYKWFLARWAKRMSWTDVAKSFHTSWKNVFRSVQMAVNWGRDHMDLKDVKAIGIDEIQWQKGHHYLTLVYQIDEGRKRLLWIGQHRKVKTLLRFFRWFGNNRSAALQFICTDMWKPYLKVIAKKAAKAVHVLDRFHIMSHMSKAIDKVRAEESRELKAKGYEPILKGSRWLLLKRPENLTDKQETKLKNLLQYNLKAVRSYLLKEEFQFFWDYISPTWAGRFMDKWCKATMRSRIEPMKKVAKMLRGHRKLLMNWFRAKGQFSSGAVEGFNNKAKLTTRKAFGFRTYQAIEVALFHTLGDLPEPEMTHKFC